MGKESTRLPQPSGQGRAEAGKSAFFPGNGPAYPPKVTAMYEAVLDLFASGRELTTLKVSEITAKAGIGKGTAYEYFSSKKEMIVGAIEYEAARHFYMIMDLIKSGQSFREIIFRGLDMMEASNQRYSGFTLLEKIMKDNTITGNGLWEEIKKHSEGCGLVPGLTRRLLELATENGQIQEADPFKVWSAILSQFMVYAFYLTHQKLFPEMEREAARETVYQNILKMLH